MGLGARLGSLWCMRMLAGFGEIGPDGGQNPHPESQKPAI